MTCVGSGELISISVLIMIMSSAPIADLFCGLLEPYLKFEDTSDYSSVYLQLVSSVNSAIYLQSTLGESVW